jgi:purine-binding chemotaxis protein CheW
VAGKVLMQAIQLRKTTPATPPDTSKRTGKYLIFRLGLEEFGAEVLKVREIISLQDITAIPQVPTHVKGVINLRGKVIPVIDLRLKLRMEPQESTPLTCIVVMRTRQDNEDLLIGIIVDGVVEVLNLTASDIEDTPDFGAGMVTPYLTGIAEINGRVKILLDIDRVLSTSEPEGFNDSL